MLVNIDDDDIDVVVKTMIRETIERLQLALESGEFDDVDVNLIFYMMHTHNYFAPPQEYYDVD